MSRPGVMLVGPTPPLKGGITTFLLNLMSSPLKTSFEFVSYSISRPQKKNVIDNWGWSSLLKGGLGRLFYGIFLTSYRFFVFPFVLGAQKIDIVQTHGSDYQSFWEAVAYTFVARIFRRPVLLRLVARLTCFMVVLLLWPSA